MERNVDKIKRLEKEIGRYQKKVADQAKEKERMRRMLETAEAGAIQTHRAVDAILAQTAITFGEVVKDEETGAELGHRLTVPAFKVGEILGKYQVRTRRDEETGAYTIGVVPREEMGSPAGPSEAVQPVEGGTLERARPAACGGAGDAEEVTTQ